MEITIEAPKMYTKPVTIKVTHLLQTDSDISFHHERALANGVTKDELIELITHLASTQNEPTAVSAVMVPKDMFKQEE